jgi:hypothetical protein
MSHGEPDSPDPAAVPGGGRRRRRFGSPALWLVGIAAIALGVAIYLGLQDRRGAGAALVRATEDAAIPVVSVARPSEGATDELTCQDDARAFTDAAIYARTSGYLAVAGRHRHPRQAGPAPGRDRDPEIDQQLRQRAQLDTAQANLDLAKTTAARWRRC